MSLGGYKFEGRYSNRGSLTDTEWCLQIHKTRIAAFMAANARANAGWTFDYSDGQLPYGTSGNVTSYTFFKKTSYYAGYAVKGKHIISIQQCEALDKYAISILTADPYSTMFNPDSPVVKFGYYCFIGRTESASNGEAYIGSSFGSTSMDYEYYTVSSLQLLNKDSLPTSSEYFSYRLIPSPISVYYPPVQEYPFSAITAIGTSNLSLLKTSGIGNIYIDLLSWNCVPYQQSNFNMYESVANGNYLTIGGVTFSSGGNSYVAIFGYTSSYWNDTSGQNQRIFCGWDSSNPDITLTSAWEEYTE